MALILTVTAADGTTGTITAPDPIVVAVPPSGLSATIALAGTTYLYDPSTAKPLANYIDPQGRFIQTCTPVTNPGLPGVVLHFRPDVGGARDEVVFEVGDIWASAPTDLTNFTATVLKNGTAVQTYTIPRQWAHSRWRYQSAPRPVDPNARTAAMKSGIMPPFNVAYTRGFTPAPSAGSYSGPMGAANIYPNMQSTGERPDIGLVPEPFAYYLATGNATALNTVLAWLEASGTIPWHFRDKHTNKPVDFTANPKLTYYQPSPGSTVIPRPANTGWVPDSTHEPCIGALPFVLTGDPYALEELQFAATFNVLSQPTGVTRNNFNMAFAPRAFAWTLRNVALLAKLAPSAAMCPDWMWPREYWQAQLDATKAFVLATFVNSTAQPQVNFHNQDWSYGSQPGQYSIQMKTFSTPWQQEFILAVYSWMVLMGHTDWLPIAQWKAQETISRTSTVGWQQERPVPYELALKATAADPWLTNWKDAWDLNVTLQAPNLTITTPGSLTITKGGEMTYPSYTAGALALAVKAGVTNALPSATYMKTNLQANMKGGYYANWKWAIDYAA